MDQQWRNRAASAEAAIATRHLRKLLQVPGTQLGVVGWPPTAKDLSFATWHYWWQAHLLDTLVDAEVRDPAEERHKWHKVWATSWIRGIVFLISIYRWSAAAHSECPRWSRAIGAWCCCTAATGEDTAVSSWLTIRPGCPT